MTWGINLGLDNATNALNLANSILKAFSSAAVQSAQVFLDLLEIGQFSPSWRCAPVPCTITGILTLLTTGNEADLYSTNGLRPANWDVEDYVPDWINISTPVANAIKSHPLRKRDSSEGQGPVAIQGAAFAGQGFTPREIFALGILDSTPGELITT